jgi:hypothetical protein
MYLKTISFTEKIRQAAQRLKERGKEPFETSDLGHEAGVRTQAEHKKMVNAVHEMRKTGEIVSVSRGRYQYIGRKKQYRKDKMWRVIRAKRTFSLDDLAELGGASRLYCKEFVALLIRRGIVKKISKPGVLAVYRLVEDPGPGLEPDRKKAEKLREIRARQKLMLEALDRFEDGIREVRKMLLDEMAGEEEQCKQQQPI